MYLYNCTVVVINDPVIIDNEKKIFTIIFSCNSYNETSKYY